MSSVCDEKNVSSKIADEIHELWKKKQEKEKKQFNSRPFLF